MPAAMARDISEPVAITTAVPVTAVATVRVPR